MPDAWSAWWSSQGSGSLSTLFGLGLVSLVPAALLMTTSFVRISVVLGLLRHALGANNLPSNQVITALSVFLTVLIMRPVWNDVYRDSIEPYTKQPAEISADEAWRAGLRPVRRFMSRQIEVAGNSDDVWLFYEYSQRSSAVEPPASYDDVPFEVLAPAFLLSELKVAFLIGFKVFLPLLVVDLLVASVSSALGMVMLPPAMVSMPLKILLFVLVDGWRLVVSMLLESFAPYG